MPGNDERRVARQGRTIDELAVLLEDALSAAAGWTVPPPEIQPMDSAAGAVNWTVDLSRLDDGMRAAVRNLQARYELRVARPIERRSSPGGWAIWRRGGHLLI